MGARPSGTLEKSRNIRDKSSDMSFTNNTLQPIISKNMT